MKPTPVRLAVFAFLSLLAASAAAGTLNKKKVRLVSTTAVGAASEVGGMAPSLSKSGRYVAFVTLSASLLPGVTPNGKAQIVRKDTKTGKLLIVSVNALGELADEVCSSCVLSANGKRIAFLSRADNLDGVGNDNQVFWKDLVTGELRRISESLASTPANDACGYLAMSDDGNRVVFASTATNLPGATAPQANGYVYDVNSATLERVTFGAQDVNPNQSSYTSDISGNGRYVCFATVASNMGFPQASASLNVFVRDLLNDETELVTFGSNGQAANSGSTGPAISKTGRYVSFLSAATNLIAGGTTPELHAFVLDRKKSKIKLLNVPAPAPGYYILPTDISSSGRRIMVPLVGPNPDHVADAYSSAAIVDRVSGKHSEFFLSGQTGIGIADEFYTPAFSRHGKKLGFVSNSPLLGPIVPAVGQVYTAKCGKL